MTANEYRDRVAVLIQENHLLQADEAITQWATAYPRDARVRLARAELLARQGKVGKAVEVFASAADHSPAPERVWLRVADLYAARGQQAAAIEACRSAVAADPDALEPAIRFGDLLRIAGRLDEAGDVLEPLLARAGSSLAVRHALAAVRNGQARFAEVIELLEPAYVDGKLPANARQHYAVALGELGRWADAADVWATLLEDDPYLVEGYYRLARISRRLRRSERSNAMLKAYEQLADYNSRLESARKLELAGHVGQASLERAAAFARTHQLTSALEQYRLALEHGTDPTESFLSAVLFCIRFDLLSEAREFMHLGQMRHAIAEPVIEAMTGLLAERERRHGDAVAAYESVLRAAPNHRQVQLSLGRIRLSEGHHEMAAGPITSAHAQSPDAESHLLMGRLALVRGRAAAAKDHFQQAASLAQRRGDRAHALFHLGRVFLAESNAAQAVSSLQRAAGLEPQMPEVWIAMAEAARQLGQSDRERAARRRAERCSALANEIAELQKKLPLGDTRERCKAYLRLAELARQRSDVADARRFLAAAIHVAPDTTEAYQRLASLHTSLPEVFFRLHALRRCVTLRPDEAGAHRALAEAYLQSTRQADRAVEHAQAALRLQPDAEIRAMLDRALRAAGRHEAAAPQSNPAAESEPERTRPPGLH